MGGGVVTPGVHPSAVIGSPPEHRDWKPGDRVFPPVIGASARLNAFVTIDSGLRAPTVIGARVFAMAHSHVGHDAVIGDDCELAPGTVIGGHAVLGQGVRCGMNVTVKPFVKVGDGARLGMGAVVIRDVPAGEVWAGNPAQRLRPRWEAHWDTAAEVIGWEEVAAHEHGDYAAG